MEIDRLTYRIIGCAMAVHKELGCGFQEVIYQRALEIEMNRRGLDFGREVEFPVRYRGVEIGTRRMDFLVGDRVMVELKALTELAPVHIAQALNYIEAYGIETGLLLNFGGQSLEKKRLYNNKIGRLIKS